MTAPRQFGRPQRTLAVWLGELVGDYPGLSLVGGFIVVGSAQ